MELVSSPRTRSPEQLDWERKRGQSALRLRVSGIVGGLVLVGLMALAYATGKDREVPASKEEFSLGLRTSHRENGMKLAFGKGVQQLASTMLAAPEQGGNSSASGNTTSQVVEAMFKRCAAVSYTPKDSAALFRLFSINFAVVFLKKQVLFFPIHLHCQICIYPFNHVLMRARTLAGGVPTARCQASHIREPAFLDMGTYFGRICIKQLRSRTENWRRGC
jgi:hypothetical protein